MKNKKGQTNGRLSNLGVIVGYTLRFLVIAACAALLEYACNLPYMPAEFKPALHALAVMLFVADYVGMMLAVILHVTKIIKEFVEELRNM